MSFDDELTKQIEGMEPTGGKILESPNMRTTADVLAFVEQYNGNVYCVNVYRKNSLSNVYHKSSPTFPRIDCWTGHNNGECLFQLQHL